MRIQFRGETLTQPSPLRRERGIKSICLWGLLFLTARFGIAQNTATPPPSGKSVEISEQGAPLTQNSVAPTTETLKLLRAIESAHGKAKTVQGTFDQLKESEIFLEKINSKGKFSYLKPDLFRCDYDPPDETTNLILKDDIYVYVPSIQQAERYHFHSPEERDQQLHVMVLGFGFKSDDITREYQVRSSQDNAELIGQLKGDKLDPAKVVLLEAVPAPGLADTAPFTRLKLWIDKASFLPQKIWFEDYNGDKTTMTNLKTQFDVTLPPSLFEAKFPKGTEIIDKTER